MTTLHDMLKGDSKDTRQTDSKQNNVDLRGHYGKIGLSAVAAGAPYRSKADDCKSSTDSYGRQTRKPR
jgi:hypothetical protein